MFLFRRSEQDRRKQEKHMRYLSQAIQLEEAANPEIIKATMTTVSIAIVIFLFWAGFTNINEVARTPGEVVPQGYQKTIQHLEGGLVKAIYVQEGDVVEKRQVLIELDEVGLKQDIARAKARQLLLQLQEERLNSFVHNREPDFSRISGATRSMITTQLTYFKSMRIAREKEARIISNQIQQKKQSIFPLEADLKTARKNLGIVSEIYKRKSKLNRSGYVSDMSQLETQHRLNELQGKVERLTKLISVAKTTIREFEDRLASLSAKHADEAYVQLAKIASDKEQNIKIINKIEERIDRLQIRAPSKGVVKGLTLNTEGAVIQPGQSLMEIVPLDKQLVVQIRISPQDIGHIKLHQPVQLKFSTYDFSRYGTIAGRLEYISATTFSGEKGERYYRGRILIDRNYVGNDPKNILIPGMTAMADVITGEKTVLQYLLKPIRVSLQTAFSER